MACKICWICAHVIFFLEKRWLCNQPFLRILGDLYSPLNVYFSSFPNILVLVVLNTPDVIYRSTLDILHRAEIVSTGHRQTPAPNQKPYFQAHQE